MNELAPMELNHPAVLDGSGADEDLGRAGEKGMTVDFQRSLEEDQPPLGLDLALQALWWAGKGDWDHAHRCAQLGEGDPRCDLVHAHLHRAQGDLLNAGTWYRRAGLAAATGPLDEEWRLIATRLLAGE